MSLVIILIVQQSQAVIGRLSVKAVMLLAVKTVKSDWCVSIHFYP